MGQNHLNVFQFNCFCIMSETVKYISSRIFHVNGLKRVFIDME